MKKSIYSVVLAAACLFGVSDAMAAFKDIRIDFTNYNLLTDGETDNSVVNYGVAVADDGTVSRVAADDPTAAIVINAKVHGAQHGLSNFSSTVAVDGPVKITFGGCRYTSTDVTIKGANGVEGKTFSTKTSDCWSNKSPEANTAYSYYKGDATTLTVAGGGYVPYIAIEAVDPSELVEEVTVSYSLGEYADAGTLLPPAEKIEVGKTITIPVNHTLFQEGKTLVGWTDGTDNYEIGEVVTVKGDMTLTPRFLDNTVTLADRKEAVTVKWNFRRDMGAPVVGWEGKEDCFWVAQAKIGTEVIDVKLPFSTKPGKFNNGNNTDWIQINNGTTFDVPSCKGAVISYESYNATTTTTIDGVVVETGGSKVGSFTVGGSAESVPLVVGDGSYYRYIQTVLPVVGASGAGEKFENKESNVIWAFNSTTDYEVAVADPAKGFSVLAVNLNGATVTGTGKRTDADDPARDENGNDIVYVKIKPVTGHTDVVEWIAKPAKGLKFTPTKVSGWIQRFGTDAENGVTVSAVTGEGEEVVLGTYTALRANKSHSHKPYDATAVNKFEIELTEAQQAQLATMESFNLRASIGVGAGKEGGFSDVRIYGKLDGTMAEVAKYTVKASINIEDAGTVTVYPKADEYDEGSEVKLTAQRNFGYRFVNWTDGEGKEVATTPEYVYTVSANAEFTANFEAVKTYELVYGVEGGANAYQVQPNPAPNVVDGKNMYEEGTNVTLTAISNPIVTFTNWTDGQSSSEISFVMDGDKKYTGVFSTVDYVVGWDFYLAGNNGRPADFFSDGNDAVSLVMRNADGEASGWLDKSEAGAGGYEGRPAGVNWKTTGLGDYYWQTTVNAESFTDMKVIGAMAYNYNAYTKQNVEASLDGETWEKLGTITIEGAKNWTDYEFTLPAKFNNQPAVSIRWISDKTSQVDGTESNNDGIAIGATYVLGTEKLVDDGTAPELVSFIPEEGSASASINGKIVLNFDEKVKVAAGAMGRLATDINGDGVIDNNDSPMEIEPTVTGKTVMFQYKNLVYGSAYTFTLAANSVMDLTDNKLDKAITIRFSTKERPAVAKALYDAEVSTADELVAALAAAAARDDKTARFRIFLHDGTYRMPASDTRKKNGIDGKEYPDPTTYINTPNISLIGESRDGVVITNTLPGGEHDNGFGMSCVLEGIGNGDVIDLEKGATGTYLQHLTVKSAMGDKKGRDIEVNDKSDKTIMKDVCLWGYQDTYVSNNQNGRFYFEGGLLRGRTDFLCGKGDVFYNAVTLQMVGQGYLAVPSQPRKYGYIFKDCEITGELDTKSLDKQGKPTDPNGSYTLGRPWGKGTPIALFIDTKMNVIPAAVGWNEMSGGWPARFAEYNSFTASGSVIDLKDRKKSFGDASKDGIYPNNPVLTKEEAEANNYSAVMGGDDDWDPASYAEQAPAPANVVFDGTVLSWDNNDYVSLWAICANGKVIDFVVEPTWSVSAPAGIRAEAEGQAIVYSVRAANEMGGLGEAVKANSQSAIGSIDADSEVISTVYYNLQGIQVTPAVRGTVLIKVDTLRSGETVTSKIVVK